MSHFKDVGSFMVACDQGVSSTNHTPELAVSKLRAKLILEELTELCNAIGFDNAKFIEQNLNAAMMAIDNARSQQVDFVEVADALLDIEYVTLGAGHAYGLDLERGFKIVHESNMAKINKETGKVLKNEFGKVVKPDGWIAPDLSPLID